MNGKQRILTALERGRPDVVPIWEMAYNEASIIGIAKHFLEADQVPEIRRVMGVILVSLIQSMVR